VYIETKEHQSGGCTHIHQTNGCLSESWCSCFLGQERNSDGRIHATRDHNNVTVYCETLKKKCLGPFRTKIKVMLAYVVVLLHDNARPYAAACTWALLELLNWELFDHPSYSPDLAPNDYHLFTYLKNWSRSQCFNNNEGLMEHVKTWLSSQAADFFDMGI
jgi:hypothetical protein